MAFLGGETGRTADFHTDCFRWPYQGLRVSLIVAQSLQAKVAPLLVQSSDASTYA